MLGSARPLIGSRLFLVSTRKRRSNTRSMKSLFMRSKGGSDPFERLVVADRQGSLQYTRHLVIRTGRLPLTPQSLQTYTSYFRSLNKLQTLVIHGPDIPAFIPVFDDCFGMFTHSLRCLDITYILDSERQLLLFIGQFPLLEDLSIQSCHVIYSYPSSSPPMPRTSPPFRGHLKLSIIMDSQSLCEALAQLPGGLKFTSLELKGCKKPAAIVTACQLTLKSVSFTWTSSLGKHHSIPSERPVVTAPSSCRSCPGPQRLFFTREIRIQGRLYKPLQYSTLALPNPVENQLPGAQRGHNLDFEMLEFC